MFDRPYLLARLAATKRELIPQEEAQILGESHVSYVL